MPSSEIIGWFADIGLSDRPSCRRQGRIIGRTDTGGHSRAARLRRAHGCVRAFSRCARKGRADPVREWRLSARRNSRRSSALSQHLRARLERAPLPDDVNSEILAAYTELCGGDSNPPLAVRSSATTEDAEDASFAGLQDTYLWTIGAQATLRYVRSCWASLYSAPSITYRRKREHAGKQRGDGRGHSARWSTREQRA